MNNKLLILAAIGVCFVVVAVGQKSESNRDSMPIQRYQLTSTHLEREGNVVLMLDTKEGRVWEYQPAARTPDGKPVPESFFPIGIGLPIMGAPSYGLKSAAIEDTAGVK